MRKIIAVLAAAALLGTLCACEDKPVDSESVGDFTVPAVTEAAPEPEPEVVPEPEPEVDQEYLRSIGEVQVDVDTFTQDRNAIMQIIAELDEVMHTGNYKSWLTYIDQESIDYYKLRPNLQKAEKKMPIKGVKLANLEAYFKFVFIQARKGRAVDEIRYISDTSVKAVQVQEDKDIVYYYFHKVNGTWKVYLPPVED